MVEGYWGGSSKIPNLRSFTEEDRDVGTTMKHFLKLKAKNQREAKMRGIMKELMQPMKTVNSFVVYGSVCEEKRNLGRRRKERTADQS